ncbi:hypothetical protein P168DRAFT_327449 [Aspergillus campestris IBT 28561]|uniref:DUF7514 domain-containing protein n=1 Tax=Aspergillus campestris (strain IBT 28561) TaxID=1392248 RepID=A0A2I1D3R4_ASPC2|nr:uncharacterized protein P168DRAFT_327449 [Aspergillus campestris IBT 28561]PKY04510.1 hypothetical protein P168DRAFT_327449 [Aspergillus campestris IBT 28561]
MSSHDPAGFWGTLINADKSPSPRLEQLCLGIAQIMSTFDEFATTDLTPGRLAAFYRKTGGNYDVLFLDTKPSALSFIYQRLGCFHSIQPSADPYTPPSVPALQPNGFVRWQTIQLLLDPEEHSQHLQNAVRQWDIQTPEGRRFPKTIPRHAFPTASDPEMVAWHEEISRRFELDYWKKNLLRSTPPNFKGYTHRFGKRENPVAKPSSPRLLLLRRRRRLPRQPRRRKRIRASNVVRAPSTYPSARPLGACNPSSFRPLFPALRRLPPRRDMAHGRLRPSGRPDAPNDPPSDYASSEDSSVPEPRRPAPTVRQRSYNRALSPPRTSHARRHSHEAYFRKPHRDLSPDSPRRRPSYRDAAVYHHTGGSGGGGGGGGRHSDSDGARRARVPRSSYPEDGPSLRARTPPPQASRFATPDASPPSGGVSMSDGVLLSGYPVHPRYVNRSSVSRNVGAAPFVVRRVAPDGDGEVRRHSYGHRGSGSAERARYAQSVGAGAGPSARPSRWSTVSPGPGSASVSASWNRGGGGALAPPMEMEMGMGMGLGEGEYPSRGWRSSMYER